jgi:hypothetical protein
MAVLADGRTMPTTQFLAERLWVHMTAAPIRRTPDEDRVIPLQAISALVEAGDMATAETEFRSWVEHIFVNVLGMGIEFKMMALVGKLKEALHAKNPAIWTEGDAGKTREDIRDTLLAVFKLSELNNYNEEGQWIGPSP